MLVQASSLLLVITMYRHIEKVSHLTGHDFGVDFKSNLTNGSRNVLGAHGRDGRRREISPKVVIYIKKIILGRFLTLLTFFSAREKNSAQKNSPTIVDVAYNLNK